MKCLICGDDAIHQRFMGIPGYIMVPNMYFLCESHKDDHLLFENVYNDDGSRKELRQSQADSEVCNYVTDSSAG